MNLEQIKQTQENINHQLSKILEELKAVVSFIAGNELAVLGDKMQDEDTIDYTNGILEKIAYRQEENTSLLYQLQTQVSKLSDSTWQSEQVVKEQDVFQSMRAD